MLSFRYAREADVDLFYEWANDEASRKNSYNQNVILYEDHVAWFAKRVTAEDFVFYIFSNADGTAVGQLRFEKKSSAGEAVISISIDKAHRGKGYSATMLQTASNDFLDKNDGFKIIAYVFKTNEASYRSFLKAGYKQTAVAVIKSIPSYILSYSK